MYKQEDLKKMRQGSENINEMKKELREYGDILKGILRRHVPGEWNKIVSLSIGGMIDSISKCNTSIGKIIIYTDGKKELRVNFEEKNGRTLDLDQGIPMRLVPVIYKNILNLINQVAIQVPATKEDIDFLISQADK